MDYLTRARSLVRLSEKLDDQSYRVENRGFPAQAHKIRSTAQRMRDEAEKIYLERKA